MATETVENYIQATYVLRQESPSGKAGVVRLAQEVGVTKGTATGMIKRLAKLNLDWADVHEKAERLEHANSPRTLDRLDEFRRRPSTDSHGHPVPSASGKVSELRGEALSAYIQGAKVEIVRIRDQDRALLKFCAQSGLKHGMCVTVKALSPEGDSVIVQVKKRNSATLSSNAAAKILARLQ